MLKAIYTRKNYITIALACMYSFLMVFVGLCLDNGSTMLSPKNPINMLGAAIGLPAVTPNINGIITLFLCGVFFAVFVAAVIYQHRVAVVAGRKPFSFKMVMAYILTAFVCLALSVGVGTVCDSKKVLLLISGHNKARALRHCVEGGVDHAWTISALQLHQNGIIACDEAACGELKVDTYKYFKEIYKNEK